MKQILLLVIVFLVANTLFAQVSGNINYQNQTSYPDININVGYPSSSDIIISVKGLANVKASSFVAIFSVTQTGKTADEVNTMMNSRINQALDKIKSIANVETYVDMISFVPTYEYVVEKKIFSKKTYNEVPSGFELKKNIHLKYTDSKNLDEIISELSSVEIYDLVRVDYFSDNIENAKKELLAKAKVILQEKIANYQTMVGTNFDTIEKQMVDGYRLVLPAEQYKSYKAYNSTTLNLNQPANVNQVDKSTTLYYQPIIDKEFDFVLNPTVLEPVIQVMYELKMKVNREKANLPKPTKEYIWISPTGELKNFDLKK